MMYLFNTLTNKIERFQPLNQSKIGMYVCGPTVYDFPHIGNARSSIVYDVLYRLLRHVYGPEVVVYTRNITDLDDKINTRAKENGVTIHDVTKKYTKHYHDDMDYLQCLRPTFEPRATQHIQDMILIIQKLIDNGHAYEANKHVYYDISSYADYGKLSGRILDDLQHGARIDVDQHKKNPGDFVLWKPSDDEDDQSIIFDSPWGKGRPGWHIECSAMSYHFLGESFDIHGGGADLMFPHHENEIAQSCGAFHGATFARYWVHNGFVTVAGEKMSKSLGNFITVHDMRTKEVNGEVLRLALLNAHYRKPLDFSAQNLSSAEAILTYCYRAMQKFHHEAPSLPDDDFLNAMLFDMNIPLAIARMYEIAKLMHKSETAGRWFFYQYLKFCGDMLGVLQHDPDEWMGMKDISEEQRVHIEQLVKERSAAKAAKDWEKADAIRSELDKLNIILEDDRDGATSWYRNISRLGKGMS